MRMTGRPRQPRSGLKIIVKSIYRCAYSTDSMHGLTSDPMRVMAWSSCSLWIGNWFGSHKDHEKTLCSTLACLRLLQLSRSYGLIMVAGRKKHNNREKQDDSTQLIHFFYSEGYLISNLQTAYSLPLMTYKLKKTIADGELPNRHQPTYSITKTTPHYLSAVSTYSSSRRKFIINIPLQPVQNLNIHYITPRW